jgi:hypothetical protein
MMLITIDNNAAPIESHQALGHKVSGSLIVKKQSLRANRKAEIFSVTATLRASFKEETLRIQGLTTFC